MKRRKTLAEEEEAEEELRVENDTAAAAAAIRRPGRRKRLDLSSKTAQQSIKLTLAATVAIYFLVNNPQHTWALSSPRSSQHHLSPAASAGGGYETYSGSARVGDSPFQLVEPQLDSPSGGASEVSASEAIGSEATGGEEETDGTAAAEAGSDDGSDQPGLVDNSQEAAENNQNPFMERHHSQLQAMQDLFERRQLAPHQHQHHQQQVPASQELNPISIGLDAHPFGPMSPFGGHPVDGPAAPKALAMNQADGGGGPMDGPHPLQFGLNPLPHMLGFPGAAPPPFEGPQRGDQSAHSNSHSSLAQGSETDSTSVGGGGGGQRVWPKIFKFTDGRINLSDFEKQKKIRLSAKHNSENHVVETPPIMFDNRPLKRKSFLILHGGIFSR